LSSCYQTGPWNLSVHQEFYRQGHIYLHRLAVMLSGFPFWHTVDDAEGFFLATGTYAFQYFCTTYRAVFVYYKPDNNPSRGLCFPCHLQILDIAAKVFTYVTIELRHL